MRYFIKSTYFARFVLFKTSNLQKRQSMVYGNSNSTLTGNTHFPRQFMLIRTRYKLFIIDMVIILKKRAISRN
jgi:hypothetical protein